MNKIKIQAKFDDVDYLIELPNDATADDLVYKLYGLMIAFTYHPHSINRAMQNAINTFKEWREDE